MAKNDVGNMKQVNEKILEPLIADVLDSIINERKVIINTSICINGEEYYSDDSIVRITDYSYDEDSAEFSLMIKHGKRCLSFSLNEIILTKRYIDMDEDIVYKLNNDNVEILICFVQDHEE